MLALPAASLAAVGLAAGCTGSLPSVSVTPPADLAAAEAAARTERSLLAGYDAAIARHPGLASLLGGLRAHHAQHLAALTAQVPSLATASPAATATSTSTAPTTATATPAGAVDDSPAARAGTLAELSKSEQAAAAAHRAGCLAVTTGLAPLLASLHAAETCHADLLTLAGSAG